VLEAGLGGGSFVPYVITGGAISYSGVTLDGMPDPLTTTEIVPAEPFLRLSGSVAPGGFHRLSLFGPSGAVALIGITTESALLELPGIPGGPLQLALEPLPVTMALTALGQDTAATQLLTSPNSSALVGRAGIIQGALLPPDGLYLTTVTAVVFRP
jgi:hypothetical protein